MTLHKKYGSNVLEAVKDTQLMARIANVEKKFKDTERQT